MGGTTFIVRIVQPIQSPNFKFFACTASAIGARPPGNCAAFTATGGNLTATARDTSPLWTYGDAVSWTKGKHTLQFGTNIRFIRNPRENFLSSFS